MYLYCAKDIKKAQTVPYISIQSIHIKLEYRVHKASRRQSILTQCAQVNAILYLKRYRKRVKESIFMSLLTKANFFTAGEFFL